MTSILLVSLLSAAVSVSNAAEKSPLQSVAPLVEQVKGAVVNVDVTLRGGHPPGPGFEPMDPFMGPMGKDQAMTGAGSGFIIDSGGLVLTNNHVVDGAVSIRVRLDDGRNFDAKVLGRDPLTDVALLKLKGKT